MSKQNLCLVSKICKHLHTPVLQRKVRDFGLYFSWICLLILKFITLIKIILVGKAFKQKTLPTYTVGESLMPEYTGRMTNIAPKTMLADYERLQSDTNQS